MPLKMRCKGCGKGLNVPDRARGKAVKCPSCGTGLRVPAEKETEKAATGSPRRSQKKRARTQPERPQDLDEDDPLAGIDLRRAADSRVRVCVKCGTEVDEETIDCPECGHNVDTGIMSPEMREKRARRGPDPEEFWGTAWTGSFQFVKNNMHLVWRTAGYWITFLTFLTYAVIWFLAVIAIQTAISGSMPWELIVFFTALIVIFVGGLYGWYWKLCINVTPHTMSRKRNKPLGRVHFDFFECLALGIKFMVWPYILWFPVWVAVGVLLTFYAVSRGMLGNPLMVATEMTLLTTIISFVMGLAQALVFPLGMVHMSMPYTYKAWTPYHMAIALGKNILPALYYLVIFLAAITPFVLTVIIIQLAWTGGIEGFARDLFMLCAEAVIWFLERIGIDSPDEKVFFLPWWMLILVHTLVLVPLALFYTTFCIPAAFGAVFLMRANGYVGLYFADKLDLVREQRPNTIAGFWPRYVSFLVDWLVLIVTIGLLGMAVRFVTFLLDLFGMNYLIQMVGYLYLGSFLVIPWLYFARPQGKVGWQGSIGQRSLGLIVTTEDHQPLDFAQSTIRFFLMGFLSGPMLIVVGGLASQVWQPALLIFGGLGAVAIIASGICAAVTEKKQALHDLLLKTLVVWQGDDERNQMG